MTRRFMDYEVLLSPGEVAKRFGVDVRTVRAWRLAGKLAVTKTPSGQNKFYESQIMCVMAGEGDQWVPPGEQ